MASYVYDAVYHQNAVENANGDRIEYDYDSVGNLVEVRGPMRRSEIAAFALADLEAKSAGLLLDMRRSKTDPEARGQVVGIAPGRCRDTDPIVALDDWLALCGRAPGPGIYQPPQAHRRCRSSPAMPSQASSNTAPASPG
ncbi:hypothetical protein [Nocardioides panzhihuensis]|uniref:YD repeat-containing protein n=1 Tax=Nocardioides panzhihuensis TaxID=860243 RepID=A0A7Z0IQ16_9ACTN|nr:hypothetical protein [Nocardioides panzhihuensis]NYI75484.1 YD repeat-containing protein [Nocardioides panzhihuensis]